MIEDERIVESFDQVYEEVFPILIRVAYHITGSTDVSEELCQEAFIRYISREAAIPTVEQSRYWLIRVVKNLCYNYVKRKGREGRAVDRIKELPQPETSNGEHELIRKEEIETVQAALMQLPLKLRTVIILKEYGQLSYKEIASILRITEGNVKVRVYRARAGLEDILSGGGL
ncbi:MAG: RNA polymerase sigma factor [Spirochaetales bacterium]|uniref:RNA polymerase sigma factor n=1 Tax=Candidatus Thalassospirochaeta sargassi TaxID=3119039 RepID=A0AAJ1IDV9_9SPIO|nr:RNA polymerase sigma factor [Spirochaetales bacterium]